jgi:7-keto-8-aminopelargonate synthetase-like enzyme
VNRSRSFIFSTAPSPVVSAAAEAAVRFVQSEEGEQRCRVLWKRVEQLRGSVDFSRFDAAVPSAGRGRSTGPISPVLLGNEERSLQIFSRLLDQGLFVPAIRYPTVGRGRARLRITLTAAHTEEQVAALARRLVEIQESLHHA